jgi:hypothetical protein
LLQESGSIESSSESKEARSDNNVMAQSLNTTCEEESMLFEAQAEVQTLRTELYATRRAAYEAKAGRLAAVEKCTILQEKVDVMAASLKQLEKQKVRVVKV